MFRLRGFKAGALAPLYVSGRSRRHFRSLSSLLCGLLLFASTAVAQTPAGREPAGYRSSINEAVAEYEAGNFAEARSLFDKANGVYSTARALRGLGMTEFELRNYSDSIAYLERALDSTVQALEGQLRVETEQLLARARGFIAQVNLAIEPGEATVVVDGTPVALGSGGRLVLEVGDHVLEFSAQGHVPEKRVVKVKGGEQQALRIVLPSQRDGSQPLQLQVQPSSAAGPTAQNHVDSGEPAKKPLYKNPWLWTGVGVVVVAVAVGLGVGLTRKEAGVREPLVPMTDAVVVAK